ncbi:MAG TPA: NUMOD4 domain-containing protein, partial [Dongiaceae bacterium]|nr:NUMOD4 domain-containing protein [Dongiaceae bacterium]
MNEKFLPVKGYEGQYEVGENGTVRSIDRISVCEQRTRSGSLITTSRLLKGKILRTVLTAGYPSVALCKDAVTVTTYVHHLVADHFVGNKPDGSVQICHNDGNPLNPNFGNLRYDTPTGNASDRVRHGTDAIGENNPASKYSVSEVKHVKTLLSEGLGVKRVAEIIGIPRT